MVFRIPQDFTPPEDPGALGGSGVLRLPVAPGADTGAGDAASSARQRDGLDGLNRLAAGSEARFDTLLDRLTQAGPRRGLAKRVGDRLTEEGKRLLAALPPGTDRDAARAMVDGLVDRYREKAVAAEHARAVMDRVTRTEELLAGYVAAAGANPDQAADLAHAGTAALSRLADAGHKRDAVAARRVRFHADLGGAAARGTLALDGATGATEIRAGVYDKFFAEAEDRARLRALADDWQAALAEDSGRPAPRPAPQATGLLQRLTGEGTDPGPAMDPLAGLAPEARAAAEDRHALAAGELPRDVAHALTSDLLSGEAARFARAAGRIRELSPVLLRDLARTLPTGALLEARAAAPYLDLGLPPQRLRTLARERIARGARRLQAKTKRRKSQASLDLRGRLGAAARMGRGGDSEIGHLTPGERIVPPGILTPELAAELDAAYETAGLDAGRYTVGGADDSINPATGAREFFLEGGPGEANPDFSAFDSGPDFSLSGGGGFDSFGGGFDAGTGFYDSFDFAPGDYGPDSGGFGSDFGDFGPGNQYGSVPDVGYDFNPNQTEFTDGPDFGFGNFDTDMGGHPAGVSPDFDADPFGTADSEIPRFPTLGDPAATGGTAFGDPSFGTPPVGGQDQPPNLPATPQAQDATAALFSGGDANLMAVYGEVGRKLNSQLPGSAGGPPSPPAPGGATLDHSSSQEHATGAPTPPAAPAGKARPDDDLTARRAVEATGHDPLTGLDAPEEYEAMENALFGDQVDSAAEASPGGDPAGVDVAIAGRDQAETEFKDIADRLGAAYEAGAPTDELQAEYAAAQDRLDQAEHAIHVARHAPAARARLGAAADDLRIREAAWKAARDAGGANSPEARRAQKELNAARGRLDTARATLDEIVILRNPGIAEAIGLAGLLSPGRAVTAAVQGGRALAGRLASDAARRRALEPKTLIPPAQRPLAKRTVEWQTKRVRTVATDPAVTKSRSIAAEHANREFGIQHNTRLAKKGPQRVDPHAPFDLRLPVHEATLAKEGLEGKFVRVFKPEIHPETGEIISKVDSSWLMLKSDYEKILRQGGPELLKDRFALSSIPTHVVPVEPKGAKVFYGIASRHAEMGNGGGLQFWIRGTVDKNWFGTTIPIR